MATNEMEALENPPNEETTVQQGKSNEIIETREEVMIRQEITDAQENLPEKEGMETQDSVNKEMTKKHENAPNKEVIQTVTYKTEEQDSESSTESMVIASDEDPVKREGPEWQREEDKLILEVLKDNLTPEERMDKTILEILQERNVYEMLADTLSGKSVTDIHERVLYLLEMLLLSEK